MAEAPRPLQPCPDCEHMCSTLAQACPNCGRPFPPPPGDRLAYLNDTIFTHIMNQGSVKVGMCLTLLGLMKVVEGVKQVTSITDELLAVDAVAFLFSTMLTYFALKNIDQARKRALGRIADIAFSGALVLLAVICGFIAFELF
jgi:hypothetical protein